MAFIAVFEKLGELVFKRLLIRPVATGPLGLIVGICLLNGEPHSTTLHGDNFDPYYVIMFQVIIDIVDESIGYLGNVD